MILCEWEAPEGHPGQCCVHLYAFVSYQRLSSQFQFSLSAVTLVYLSQCSRWDGLGSRDRLVDLLRGEG